MSPKTAPLAGVHETALYVDDLAAAVRFYRDVLGLAPLAGDPARFQAFGVGGRNVLLIFKRGTTLQRTAVPGGFIPPHDAHGQQHVGFAVAPGDFDGWRARLTGGGVAIEEETNWPNGARSLYFRDPAGHLLEILTPDLWPL